MRKRLMAYKRLIMILLCFRAFHAPGQGAGVPVSSVYTDAKGNTWQRKVEKTFRVRPSVPVNLYPSGDILLPRLKSKWISYQGIQPGDTLRCTVVSRSGQPFKMVRIQFSDSLVFQYRDVASAGYSNLPPGASFRLQIKAKPSLKRQIATVLVSRIPPTRLDTLVNTTDILLKPATGADTLAQPIWTSVSASGLQTAWAGEIKTDKPNEQVKRKKELVVLAKPALRTTLPPSGTMLVRRLRNTTVTVRDFLPGDTIRYTAKCRGKNVFSAAALFDQDHQQLAAIRDLPQFQGTVVISRETALQLVLRSKWLLGNTYADVVFVRIRPVPSDTFYQITDSLFRSRTVVLYDTIPMTILDDSLTLSPLWDLEASQTNAFQIQAPTELAKGGKLDFICYWFATDHNDLLRYQTLETAIPETWSLPGWPRALGAFALGKQIALPEVRLDNLEGAFTSTAQKRLFMSGKPYKKLIPIFPNFGTLSAAELKNMGILEGSAKNGTAAYRFHLCFKNRSTVNTYQCFLKVAACYTKVKSRVTTTEFVQTSSSTEPLSK